MINILKDNYFNEYYTTGFVATGISLADGLIEEIRDHYKKLAEGHIDFPKFFVNNEHQAYLEGRALGILFSLFPNIAKKMVKKLYDKSYKKAVFNEQVFIEKVCQHLLKNNFQKFFKTRFLLASYDMYLRSGYKYSAAGIHTDLPNFHHFYETENDLSLYIPLVDLNDDNGGRISVLPESKLKVPGNILLKLLERHFLKAGNNLDENGYMDPEKITAEDLEAFIKSKPHKALLEHYKNATALAKTHYLDDFEKPEESRGKVLLFNNKNFHAAESWKKEDRDREIYTIRLLPLYDTKIKLKTKLHGKLFNNFLIDMETGEIHSYDHAVDVSRIPQKDKLAL